MLSIPRKCHLRSPPRNIPLHSVASSLLNQPCMPGSYEGLQGSVIQSPSTSFTLWLYNARRKAMNVR
jgi:hypothetical protein